VHVPNCLFFNSSFVHFPLDSTLLLLSSKYIFITATASNQQRGKRSNLETADTVNVENGVNGKTLLSWKKTVEKLAAQFYRGSRLSGVKGDKRKLQQPVRWGTTFCQIPSIAF